MSVKGVGVAQTHEQETKLGRLTALPHPGSLQIGAITEFCPLLGSFLPLIFPGNPPCPPDLLRACLLAYSRFKLEINIYQQTHSAPSVVSADRILGCKTSSGFGSMAFYLQPPALCWKSLVCCHPVVPLTLLPYMTPSPVCLSVSLPLAFPFLEGFRTFSLSQCSKNSQ